MGKKDVTKNAAAEWVSKWTPAILACVQGMRGKVAQSAIQEAERKFTGTLLLLLQVIVHGEKNVKEY